MARIWGAVGLLALAASCGAQQLVAPVARPIVGTTKLAIAVPAAASTVMLQMANHATVIFAGQVLSVEHGMGCVEIRFRIDHRVRGVAAGGAGKTSTYVLREWSGLWSGHPDRYIVGERLLMLLPARSSSGMSAPVGGLDGAIPLVAMGAAPIADGAGVAPVDLGAGTPELAVDLRWIEARALRPAVSAQSGSVHVAALRTTGSIAAFADSLVVGIEPAAECRFKSVGRGAECAVLALGSALVWSS